MIPNNQEKRIEELEKENRYLKFLLCKMGIDVSSICSTDKYTMFDNVNDADAFRNQDGLIQQKPEINEDDAVKFFSMFWGRTDVYSQRTIVKSTGIANYYPQCSKIWKQDCPKKIDRNARCSECQVAAFIPLQRHQIIAHLRGDKPDGTDVIGIYPLFSDDTCRLIVFDFDNHERGAEKNDFSNVDDVWKSEVDALREICKINGIDALVERSRSGKGAHLWIFFKEKINAGLARKFGNALLAKGAESVNLRNFRYYDRMLPMQDHMPKGGFGNVIALPLQGQALKKGNSAFVDENWNAYADQWGKLFSVKKLEKEFIEEKIKEWQIAASVVNNKENELFVLTDEKPWQKIKNFEKSDVNGKLKIVLANGMYIKTDNLKPRIQNRIRELAAFSNPIFYKNQIMGLSNFDNARYIYLGKDGNGYIKIPRGLLQLLINACNKADIEYDILDERCQGHEIKVEFVGNLRESQINAVDSLSKYDTGILNAATAFGKTVVCCNLIAKKKVNTLILLQSSALLEQWKSAIEKFIKFDEQPPKYTTPTGRLKQRKSIIGKLQGANDTLTGIVDIAMVGSLWKKGEFHPKLQEYGMIILDECHHAASSTIVDILQEVNAKYVYGVTATPLRRDGLEKINYMLLGPIRYKFSTKDRAKEQGIYHWVIPRFTKAIVPDFDNEKMHPNDAYEILRKNNARDELIVSDVRTCVEVGRTPVILTRYIDHAQNLFSRLCNCADKVFLLSGNNTKKEHKQILESMHTVSPSESMILIATGSLIGEGFDFPRLDTLLMATPVAWKSVVEQYAGRLNRDYEGKDSVIIYDYIDHHIPMFARMYHKRLKAYKQIGYEIYPEGQIEFSEILEKELFNREKEIPNSIFDMDNYLKTYENDLASTKKEIIISSPYISFKKIEAFIKIVSKRQLKGVKVVIVTWAPNKYGYGDSSYWAELHDKMKREGYILNYVEDYCEHYCIIDRKIVWYGSLNFLGKEDSEDNLMRIESSIIAEELLEKTFGIVDKAYNLSKV